MKHRHAVEVARLVSVACIVGRRRQSQPYDVTSHATEGRPTSHGVLMEVAELKGVIVDLEARVDKIRDWL
jgi:hypothetical protein